MLNILNIEVAIHSNKMKATRRRLTCSEAVRKVKIIAMCKIYIYMSGLKLQRKYIRCECASGALIFVIRIYLKNLCNLKCFKLKCIKMFTSIHTEEIDDEILKQKKLKWLMHDAVPKRKSVKFSNNNKKNRTLKIADSVTVIHKKKKLLCGLLIPSVTCNIGEIFERTS